MTAKELLERYAAGERDFTGVDLSDEDLSLTNLNNINLSKATLDPIVLEGANLTGTISIFFYPQSDRRSHNLIVRASLFFHTQQHSIGILPDRVLLFVHSLLNPFTFPRLPIEKLDQKLTCFNSALSNYRTPRSEIN